MSKDIGESYLVQMNTENNEWQLRVKQWSERGNNIEEWESGLKETNVLKYFTFVILNKWF